MNRQEMLILSSPTFCLWDPTSRRDLGISWNYISFPDYRDHFLWRKWATSESGLYGIVPTEVSVLPRLHPKISKSFPAWMWWPPSPCWRPGKTCGSPTQRPLPPAGLQYWKLLDCWMEQLLKCVYFCYDMRWKYKYWKINYAIWGNKWLVEKLKKVGKGFITTLCSCGFLNHTDFPNFRYEQDKPSPGSQHRSILSRTGSRFPWSS